MIVNLTVRQRSARRLSVVAICAALSLVGCGTSDSVGSPDQEGRLPTPQRGDEADAVSLPPPTTVPVQLAPADCRGEPVEVAERLLIERRRGEVTLGCSAEPATAITDSCWHSCDDGTVFVDFDLDTTQPVAQESTNDGAIDVHVDFAARYTVDEDGTTTEAETLVLRQTGNDSAWQLQALKTVDISEESADALITVERYFEALREGDFAAASSLMAPSSTLDGRDDLGRLVDEGLLADTTPNAITDALADWCRGGAECTASPSVEIEVTATHSLRAIVTYQLPQGIFETVLLFADDGIIGLPIKVG